MYSLISQKEYSLCQSDRVKHMKNILYDENGHPIPYIETFCDLEIKPGQSIFNPSSKQPLSHDINFCTGIEQLANYILFSPDGEKINQKTQYNIYKDEDEFRKKSQSHYSFEYEDGIEVDEAIDFLIDQNHNYLCETSQKVFAKDLVKHPELKQYRDIVDEYVKIIKTIPNNKQNIKKRKKIGTLMSDLRAEQCYLKTMLDKTIIFKHVASNGEKLSEKDANGFSFTAVEQMFKNSNPNQLTPFGELGDVFQEILEKIEKTEEEKLILSCITDEAKQNYAEIARNLNMEPRFAQQCIVKIRNKIIREYMKMYEDWYFLYEDYGWYKKCTSCGETKLLTTTYFQKNAGSNDGFRANCKDCS